MTSVLFLESDELIKGMLVRQGVPIIAKPEPPNNFMAVSMIDGGYDWLVVRFFHTDDSGYTAYGMAMTATEDERRKFKASMLESICEQSKQQGVNCWEHAQIVDISKPEAN